MSELKGKFIKYEELDKTSKAGKAYKERTVLIETSDQYNPIVACSCNDKVAEYLKAQPYGSVGIFQYNIRSNEVNGKWYTSLSIYRVDISATATYAQSKEQASQNGFGTNDKGDLQEPMSYKDTQDLPF